MDFFKKQASSYLSSQEEPAKASPPKASPPKTPGEKSEKTGETPGYSELFGSANVLLTAAKSQIGGNKEGAKLDTAKIADAADDVLQAASHYGKFEGTQYEGYVKKAEGYLESYKSRDGADLIPPAEELKKSAEEVKASAPKPDLESELPPKTEAPVPAPHKPAEVPAPPKTEAPVPPKSTEEED